MNIDTNVETAAVLTDYEVCASVPADKEKHEKNTEQTDDDLFPIDHAEMIAALEVLRETGQKRFIRKEIVLTFLTINKKASFESLLVGVITKELRWINFQYDMIMFHFHSWRLGNLTMYNRYSIIPYVVTKKN